MDAAPIEVWYDGDCAVCRGAARWLAARDRAGRLALRDGREAPGPVAARLRTEIVVVEPNNRVRNGFDALCRTLVELPR